MDFFLCLQFPRSNVRSHSQTHIEGHLNLALRGLEATQHQLHELVTVVKDQSQQIARQSRQIERQSQQIARQSQQIERQSQQIERMISKDTEQTQQIKQLVSSNKELSEQITVLKMKILPTPFEWKVPKFDALLSESRREKQISVSRPFGLPERSYNFLLKIEMARPLSQDFLRLFIKVVPGEFDELLPWPCEEKVRITLVNQDLPLDDRKNISHVVYFNLGNEPCSGPLCDDHHKYRPSLALSIHELRSYITNDTILIRVNREERD